MTKEMIEQYRAAKRLYAGEGIELVGIFGSQARGDAGEDSDVDIAYRLNEPLFFERYQGFAAASRLADMASELERMFHKKVDLVSVNSLNPTLNATILKEAVDA